MRVKILLDFAIHIIPNFDSNKFSIKILSSMQNANYGILGSIFLTFTTVIFLSCQEPLDTSHPRFQDAAVLNNTHMGSRLLADYSFIPLGTRPGAPLTYLTKVKMDAGRIFVLEKRTSNSLSIFDENGQFLVSIEPATEGINPLRNIADFTLDTLDKTIYVLDEAAKQIVVYDYNANVMTAIALDFHAYAVEYFRDRLFFATSDDKQAIWITDSSGAPVAKRFAAETLRRRHFQPFEVSADGILYNHWEDDNVYLIDGTGEVTTAYEITGPNSVNPEANLGELRSFNQTEDQLILSFQHAGSAIVWLYDRSNGAAVQFSAINNDVTYGGSFLLPVLGKQGAYFISYTPGEFAWQAAERSAGQKRNAKFEALAAELSPTSNPVLILFRPDPSAIH